jgi:asparagine N-glycosylation enzyme membrane subunit Stt3
MVYGAAMMDVVAYHWYMLSSIVGFVWPAVLGWLVVTVLVYVIIRKPVDR